MSEDPYESDRGLRVPRDFARPWLRSNRPVARRVARPLESFIRLEAGGGFVLLVAALAALIWANVDEAGYERVWSTTLALEISGWAIDQDLRHWINDGLMAFFFFLIALEVKREVLFGALAERRLAAVPIAAAAGGMIIPALIYLALNANGGEPAGWAIPVATDVAFALAVLAMVGRMASGSLRAFLLTVAIVDDVGTIVIIALAFSEGVALSWLALALGLVLLIMVLRRFSVRALAPYVICALALWLAVFESGVHATLAGVILGLLTPARPFHDPDETGGTIAEQLNVVAESRDDEIDQETMLQTSRLAREAASPLTRMLAAIHPWSSYVILPLFALANAGVVLSLEGVVDVVTEPVGLGILLGLVVGKPLGLFLGSWAAIRWSSARLPDGVDLAGIAALGCVAGIGFTVALFIAPLALPTELAQEASVAILAASFVASVFGVVAFALRSALRREKGQGATSAPRRGS